MTPRNLTKLLDAGLLGISLLVLLRVAGMHLPALSAALPAGALVGLLYGARRGPVSPRSE
jgi:hypothetical protein